MFRAFFLLLATPLLAVDSVVTFNELHYNPAGEDESGEWIELHNQMAINVDLSGWRLAAGVDFTFPEGTVVPGQGFILVAKAPSHPSLSGLNALGPYPNSLSNGGERIHLYNRSDRLMDRIEYNDSGKWPVAPDGSGVTLAKLEGQLLSGKSASWSQSLQTGGTPGAVNFPVENQPIPLTFVPNDATWSYFDSTSAPPSDWNTTGFNDDSWETGSQLFGNSTSGPPVLTVTDHLVERFRASDLGLNNGQTVSTWNDTATGDGQSQNATAGGNPTYQSNVTPSGEPVVRFDGNDQLRTSLSPGISGSSGFVYLAVVRANAPPVGGGVTTGSGPYLWDRALTGGGTPLASLKADNGRFGLQKRYNNGSGLGGPVSTSPISTTDFQIVAVRRNTAANRFEMWVDGVLESTDPDSGAALTPDPINIGRHATNGSGGFNGDIAELLIYNEELTSAELEAVGSYLENRYGLDTAYPGTTINTGTSPSANTSYYRQEFTFNGNPANTSIRLDAQFSDGAVFYLNGVEIHRENVPPGPITHTTSALSDHPTPSATGILTLPSNALLNGTNVLAVSLHSASGNSTTAFGSTLEGTELPPDPSRAQGLVFSEISSALDPSFFVEIQNPTASAIGTAGYTLEISGDQPASVPLPSTTLNPGDFLVLNQSQLGQTPSDNDKLFLFTPGNGSVSDARRVTNRLRGSSPEYPGWWIFPSSRTPGSTNAFSFERDVVINELCYNSPLSDPFPGIPPTIENVSLISTSATWRYNESGDNLDADWTTVSHPVGGNWDSGPATIAYDIGLDSPIATLLTVPSSNFPRVVTYYFETDFNLTADQASSISSLSLTHLIDDGAIVYLNGVEIDRINMAAGPVDATTFASSGVGDAVFIGPETISIPQGVAVEGINRVSVEVHQSALNSSDVTFNLTVEAQFTTDPGIPAVPAAPGEEQWLEIYNRGESPVNLAGWNFGDGISYTFAENTVIAPGEYLVIAKDPSALSAAHPGLVPLGPYEGSLSRNGETVTLRDSFNNPADTLRYYDGGRWPPKADAAGSTLELTDPDADNSVPGAWSSSNEISRTSWQTYTFRATASPSTVGPDNQWREFVFGLLEEGEVLLDDLSVTEDPEGAAVPFITDGTFESGNLNSWRALGSHREVSIVPDPSNPGNNVLYLNATGSTGHMHNHVETTLRNNESVLNGREYEVSFRARWLSGNHLLHTRLYFNRIPHTFRLDRPAILGTPGQANSTLIENAGPTSENLAHFPVVPAAGESPTVSVDLSDPDGVASATLNYRVEGGNFATVPMSESNGSWTATIPGQSAGRVVQFYVTATDPLGASSFVPREGPESRAMYEVEDNRAATTCINNIRIIMDPGDQAFMFTPRNVMGNGRFPCTVIDQENRTYYNAGVRVKGSQRARTQNNRIGFNLGFPKDQLFRNVHRTIAIDRSEGQVVGQRELLFDLAATSSGGIPGEHNDLCYVISPNPVHTSAAILQLARFNSVFLGDQFEDGEDGTVYEYELIYYPTSTDAGGFKVPQPDRVVGRDVNDMGDNPEDYRWIYLIKNNQEYDDYDPAMRLGKLFSQTGVNFNAQVAETLDVDQWLRALAYSCAFGAGDSFFSNANHNGQFYGRPDGKLLYFPHDNDFAFNANRNIFENSELNRILSASSGYRRAYLSNLYEICTHVFNASWMAPWTAHFDECVPGGNVFNDDLGYINTRSNYILGQLNNQASPVNFTITTNGGNNFSTSESPVQLEGRGWFDVNEIRLASSSQPLSLTWTNNTSWNLDLPLTSGANEIILEAYDHLGSLIGSDTITITQTGGIALPDSSNLVVSEIYYNEPGTVETTEYVELLNIDSSATLDLTGTRFSDGITFTFPPGTTLAPNQRIVVVADQAAFEARFGSAVNVAGTYSGALANGGERLELSRPDSTIVRAFTYDDEPPWPTEPDGEDYSLVLIAPEDNPDHDQAFNWQASLQPGGSPGGDDSIDYLDWKLSFGNPADEADPDGDGWTVFEEFFFGGDPVTFDDLAAVTTFDATSSLFIASVRKRVGINTTLTLQQSNDLINWIDSPTATLQSTQRIPGSSPAVDLQTWTAAFEGPTLYYRFKLEH